MQDGICSDFPNPSPQDLEKWTTLMSDKIHKGDHVRLTDYERNVFVEETSKLET